MIASFYLSQLFLVSDSQLQSDDEVIINVCRLRFVVPRVMVEN